jgi:flagellar motor switch protein FliM
MDEQSAQQNQTEDLAAEGGEPGRHTGRYDFGDAQRYSDSQFRQLRLVHERFSRDFATSLSALTRRTIRAGAVACRQSGPDETRQELAQCGLLIVLDVLPLDAHVAVGMESRLVFPLLEALLGGLVSNTDSFERELTEIELSVMQDLHAILIRELEKAWRPTARLEFQVVGQQTDPRSRQPVSPAGGSLLATIDLEVEGGKGRILLSYPAQVGREIQSLDPAGAPNDAARRPEFVLQALFERLKSAELLVEGSLQGATLRLRDLINLRAGDLLCLDLPLEKHIDVTINGASRFGGRLAEVGRKKGIRIHEAHPRKRAQQWPR